MTYEFACDDCKWIVNVDRPVDQAGMPSNCPTCGEQMRRLFFPLPMLGRQKPGTGRGSLEKMPRAGSGMANTYAQYKIDEQKGGEHWAGIQRNSAVDLREMKAFKEANSLYWLIL